MEQKNSISLEQAVEREPLTMPPETPIEEVIGLMSKSWTNSCVLSCILAGDDRTVTVDSLAPFRHSCVLAIADSQIVGILTEQTLVSLISTERNLKRVTLAEVINENVITMTSTGTLDILAALNLFRRYQIRHLPIVDPQQGLIGLVTQDSLRRALRSADLLELRTVGESMSRAIHALVTDSVLKVAQLMSDYRVSCIPIVETGEDNNFLKPLGIITEQDIVQFQLLELNLAAIQAGEVMSTPLICAHPEDSLRQVHRQMNQSGVRRLVVTGTQGELLGTIDQRDLLRALDLSDLQNASEISPSPVIPLEPEPNISLPKNNPDMIEPDAPATELRERREQLVAQTSLRIRRSIDLETILETTVEEVRQLIQADRVLIYRFEPDWSGIVTTEAVSKPQWSILDRVIKDSCFKRAWLEPYNQGHIFAVADIYRANLSQCHLELLESFQVRANVAIPILLTEENEDTTAERLWGLLIVHQCSNPRNWQEAELELLQLLAIQVAIAIQQAELYQQAQAELKRREIAEAAIRESETRFRLMANTAPVTIWMTGIDKRYSFLNQPWLDFTGQTLEQAIGSDWTVRIHREDRERCQKIYSAAFDRREEFTLEYRLRKANGEYSWVLDRGVPRFTSDGEFVGYIGSGVDISSRKQAEETLRERETQLRTALDAAAMGTWIWEISTNQVILSPRSESILGLTTDESNTLAAILERIHPEDRQRIDKQAKQAIAKHGLYEIETRIILSDGKYRWVTARGHVLLDAEGQPIQMIGVIADITEKKRLEEQSLRHQRLENLGSLAGGIAHDLNNILTPIMMSLQLLPVTLSHMNPRSRELIEMLENNVKRGSALVQQVLSFARGIEGKHGIVQVKHLIRDIKQIATETFPKSIEIQTNIASNLWTVRGDATQIHQILLNLVVNARDAMPNGGLLSISAINLTIDREYVREHPQAEVGSYVAIIVSDTGVGIPPENIEQIFEPFFTTKGEEGGTGLGLATVMNIVQSHGGFIDVVSQREQGTQFNVFIPAAEVAEADSKENVILPKGKGELILVVDDEATIREITKASLETHNYRVIDARDGIEAIASYVRNQAEIAVVLMNMMMPVMDGTTAIRTLQKINPLVKVIAISGRNFTSQVFSDRQLNINSFLAKPYTTQALLQAIEDVVRGH
ncbi:MAG: PAS domain-containing protein [Pleurocapsa sp. MO_226.B13]|nr:PAS domain-containing protein [Pleurocapsa sp. MO_226.B13]